MELKTKYAAAITVGCRLNQTDTAIMFAELKKTGFEIEKIETNKKLSLVIINTCAVTSSASQKSRQYARSIKEKHPEAKLIISGCDTEIDQEKYLSETRVDLIIPNSEKNNLRKYIAQLFPEASTQKEISNTSENFLIPTSGYYPFKTRANLKIQEGCNTFCTYCIVPYTRGKPRSRDWDNTLTEFKELLVKGYKEIILTGVNVAMYNDKGRNLVSLISEMCSFKGNFRIRISSIELQFDIMHNLIELIKSNRKLCRFLHIPLQHGSNTILKRMNRNYTKEEYARIINNAAKQIPGICLGSDIITGFPGETDEIFNESLDFISSLPLSYLHVFKYSKRKGTPASTYLDQINPKISEERHKKLSLLGKNFYKDFIKKQEGKTVEIILETQKKGYLYGWTDNYIKVKIPSEKRDKDTLGSIIKIQLSNMNLCEKRKPS